MLLKPLRTKDNVVLATYRLVTLLNARITFGYVIDSILSHPHHKSLLAISDTLQNCNISVVTAKLDTSRIKNIQRPFVTQVIAPGTSNFVVITKVNNDKVEFYNAEDKNTWESFDEFTKRWTGICLFAETDESSGEEKYTKKKIAQNFFNVGMLVFSLCLLGWIAISFYKQTAMDISVSVQLLSAIYFIIKVFGVIIGGLLLWYEIDKHNSILQKICSAGKKVNCGAVLNSKQATFFYNVFSWSEIGFAYFFGTSVFLLLQEFSSGALTVISWLSFFSLPVIASSLIYQRFILKQWCKLCVIIQMFLAVEIVISFFIYWYIESFDATLLPSIIALLVLPVLGWKLLKPILKFSKERNFYKRKFFQLKNNFNVFSGLLQKSRKIKYSTEGMGISFYRKEARYSIIKVCNPYCKPCAEAYPFLEKLVEKGIINLQILFTASTNPKDFKSKPVSHFLAIDSRGDQKETQKALDYWYLAEIKSYELFSAKYPVNGDLVKQSDKMDTMFDWCKKEKIAHTPTIFINGYELPEEYKIEDLENLLV